MHDKVSKIFIALCGAFWNYACKVFSEYEFEFELSDGVLETIASVWFYSKVFFENLFREVRESFDTGLVGGIAGLTVIYVRNAFNWAINKFKAWKWKRSVKASDKPEKTQPESL